MPTFLPKYRYYKADEFGFPIIVSNKTQKSPIESKSTVKLPYWVQTYDYPNQLYKVIDGGIVSVSYPFIDKLSFTYPIEGDTEKPYRKSEEQVQLDSLIMDLPKLSEDFKSVSSKNKPYKICMTWRDKKTSEKVLIQCDPKKPKYNYLRFELNPAKLGKKGMFRFWMMFRFDIMQASAQHKDVIKKGRITRADIAVDMYNLSPSRLIVESKGKGKSITYFSADGNLETTYLGKPKTKPAHKKIYDKHQQRQDTGKKDKYPHHERTRIEYTHAGGKFSTFFNIQNPFSKFTVIDPQSGPDGIEDWVWRMFLDSCRYKGIMKALVEVPYPERKVFEQSLLQAQQLTWRPNKIWDPWKKYLKSSGIFPS